MSAEDQPLKLTFDFPVWGHSIEDEHERTIATAQFRAYQPKHGRRAYRESELWVSTQHDRVAEHLTPEQLAEVDQLLAGLAREAAQALALKLAQLMQRPLYVQEYDGAPEEELLPTSREE